MDSIHFNHLYSNIYFSLVEKTMMSLSVFPSFYKFIKNINITLKLYEKFKNIKNIHIILL